MGREVILVDGGKTCSICLKWKTLDDYLKTNKGLKHDYTARCKKCANLHTKEYRERFKHKCLLCDVLVLKENIYCPKCCKSLPEYKEQQRITTL